MTERRIAAGLAIAASVTERPPDMVPLRPAHVLVVQACRALIAATDFTQVTGDKTGCRAGRGTGKMAYRVYVFEVTGRVKKFAASVSTAPAGSN